mmetsp:Transcript_6576/g.16597  ORF Transcript_6576/g.16597 Transcript_6576/m.16597 type:complete len:276 (+) Transcript_6576:1402-2229(+)
MERSTLSYPRSSRGIGHNDCDAWCILIRAAEVGDACQQRNKHLCGVTGRGELCIVSLCRYACKLGSAIKGIELITTVNEPFMGPAKGIDNCCGVEITVNNKHVSGVGIVIKLFKLILGNLLGFCISIWTLLDGDGVLSLKIDIHVYTRILQSGTQEFNDSPGKGNKLQCFCKRQFCAVGSVVWEVHIGVSLHSVLLKVDVKPLVELVLVDSEINSEPSARHLSRQARPKVGVLQPLQHLPAMLQRRQQSCCDGIRHCLPLRCYLLVFSFEKVVGG